MASSATCLLVIFCAFLTIAQAQPAWLTDLVAWSGTQGAYKSDAYTTNAYEYAESMEGSWDKALYDPTSGRLYIQDYQILYYDSYGRLYNSGIQATFVRDFTVSLTGRILYVSQQNELWSYQPASRNLTLLVQSDVSVRYVTLDETTGRIYFSSPSSLYSMQEDGTDRITEITLEKVDGCRSFSLTGYIHVYDGTMFVPTICGSDLYMYRMERSGYVQNGGALCRGSCSFGQVKNFFRDEGFFLYDGGLELDFYSVATFTMNETSGFVVSDTWVALRAPNVRAPWTILGSLSEGEIRARELNYCYLAGRFNGTDCECNPTSFGEMCNVYCNPDDLFSCLNGRCTSEGTCECLPGYTLSWPSGLCSSVSVSNPPFYASLFEEKSSSEVNSTWWHYFSNTTQQTIVTRMVSDPTVYHLEDYNSPWQLFANSSGCVQVPLTSGWPGGPLPPDSLYLSREACPRNESILCNVWCSPDETHWYWTAYLSSMRRDVMWQEEIRLPNETISRYYSLENTSTSIPEDWTDTSNCPCWLTRECSRFTPPPRSVTPSVTPSRLTRTPSPTKSTSLTPSTSPSISYTSSISRSPSISESPTATASSSLSPSASPISQGPSLTWLWITLSLVGMLVVVVVVSGALALYIRFKRQQQQDDYSYLQ